MILIPKLGKKLSHVSKEKAPVQTPFPDKRAISAQFRLPGINATQPHWSQGQKSLYIATKLVCRFTEISPSHTATPPICATPQLSSRLHTSPASSKACKTNIRDPQATLLPDPNQAALT